MGLIIPMIKYILNGRKNKLVIQKALNLDSKPFFNNVLGLYQNEYPSARPKLGKTPLP